jgi:hypothetical protein
MLRIVLLPAPNVVNFSRYAPFGMPQIIWKEAYLKAPKILNYKDRPPSLAAEEQNIQQFLKI